jgi:hypothetical protein
MGFCMYRHPAWPPALVLAALCAPAAAQQLEPRAYSNVPVGMNFALAGYAHSTGDVLPDPSIPVTNANAKLDTFVAGYARGVDWWGKSGMISFAVPYVTGSASGLLEGENVRIERSGFADPVLRASVNLIGAPAMTLQEMRGYQQETIVGASLTVSPPFGRYDPSKLINIGTNRWSYTPQIGVSRQLGDWWLEGALGATFFTDNDQYQGTHVREQKPLYAAQAHVVYAIAKGTWIAVDYTYYGGGRTSVDGQQRDDVLSSARWGATLSLPLSAHQSVKLYASTGLIARVGSNFDTYGIAWQYRWGGGM